MHAKAPQKFCTPSLDSAESKLPTFNNFKRKTSLVNIIGYLFGKKKKTSLVNHRFSRQPVEGFTKATD